MTEDKKLVGIWPVRKTDTSVPGWKTTVAIADPKRHPLKGLGNGSAEVLQEKPTHVHPKLVGTPINPLHRRAKI